MNINPSLTTPEVQTKVRAEETNRNVAEDFVDLLKEIREELRVQENLEKWTELDFGRTTALKKNRVSKRKEMKRCTGTEPVEDVQRT
jgi:hypothetical protein